MILDLVGYVPGTGITEKVVVEPSCGCGAFMVAIAERLADEVVTMGADWDSIAGAVVGFDIDPVSLATCEDAVTRVLVAKDCPENEARRLAHGWLRHADFILDEAPKCDLVVGNPPYVRASDIDRDKRDAYCKALSSMTSGCDLYIGFFDHGLDILREGGLLCFICADRWLQNAYGRKLRGRVGSSCDLEALVRMHGVNAFDDEVDAYPAVTLVRKSAAKGPVRFVNCTSNFAEDDVDAVMEWLTGSAGDLCTERFEAFEVGRPEGDDIYPLGPSELVGFVTKARNELPSLEEAGVRVGIGVATGCDEVFLTSDEHLVEPERMLPIFYMRDHRRGHADRRRWLVNPWEDDGTLIDLDRYPKTKAYFEVHRERLSRRHVARKSERAWYRTIDKLTPGLMEHDLLLMPDMATSPDPILSRGYYPHHNCYWICSDEWDMRVLGGLLMADTTKRFVDALGVKMRGGTLRFQAQYLRLVHLPRYEQLSAEVRAGLARAFDEGDREAASRFAETAYEETMQ